MNKYRKGYNFERRIVKHLIAEGYDCARTAGSHGAADIWAARAGEFIFIQAQTDPYFPPAKIEALREMAQRHNAQARLAYTDKGKLIFKDLEDDN